MCRTSSSLIVKIVWSLEDYLMKNIMIDLLYHDYKGGGGSVGIWGCITYDGPGLYKMYDGRIDKHMYIETLENQ